MSVFRNLLMTMSSEEGGLPDEYQEVEYIENVGESYIDTGYIPYKTKSEIKFQKLNTTLSPDKYAGWALATFNANNNRYYAIAFARNESFDYIYLCGDRQNNQITFNTYDTLIHTVIYNDENNQVKFDGTVKGTVSDLTEQGTLSLYSFALHNGRDLPQEYFYGRIYYVKITDKDTGKLVRDYVPCYRKSDNEIGMYDLVNNVFYTNQGTGTFQKGKSVGTNYSFYDYIHYIGNDTSGTIDRLITTTEYSDTNSLIIDFDFKPFKEQTGSTAHLIGGRQEGYGDNNHLNAFYSRTDTKRVSAFSKASALGINDIPSVVVGNIVHVNLNPGTSNTTTLTVDNLTYSTNWTTNTANKSELAFCGTVGSRTPGLANTLSNFAGIGILRLYDTSDNLVGEWVPCIRNNDNVIGVYDTVTDTFNTVQSTQYATIGNSNCEWEVGSW